MTAMCNDVLSRDVPEPAPGRCLQPRPLAFVYMTPQRLRQDGLTHLTDCLPNVPAFPQIFGAVQIRPLNGHCKHMFIIAALGLGQRCFELNSKRIVGSAKMPDSFPCRRYEGVETKGIWLDGSFIVFSRFTRFSFDPIRSRIRELLSAAKAAFCLTNVSK